MADFFDRLVNRVTEPRDGLEPALRVRPRLSHPFERAGAVAADPFEPTEDLRFTTSRGERAPDPARVPERAPVVAASPVVPRRPSPRFQPVRAAATAPPVAEPSIQVVESVRRLVERIDIAHRPLLVPPAEPARPAPVAERVTGDERPRVPSVAGKAPVARSLPDHRIGPVERAKADQIRQSPPAERTVRVSIGRLEVKSAEPSKSRPRRPVRPQPAVSLERYLNGEEGRR